MIYYLFAAFIGLIIPLAAYEIGKWRGYEKGYQDGHAGVLPAFKIKIKNNGSNDEHR